MNRSLLLTGFAPCCLALSLVSAASQAQTLDPVDKNKSGPYLGAAFQFGQASKVGSGGGGTAWFLGIEPGYGMARDTWNRFELSAEVGTGRMTYKDKENSVSATIENNVAFYGLIKAGYGWSLGEHAFAVWRVGAGPANLDYKAKYQGRSSKASGISGLMYQLGVDVTSPMSDTMDVYGGVHWRALTYNVDEVKDAGVTRNVDRDYQVNIPMLQVGARFRF